MAACQLDLFVSKGMSWEDESRVEGGGIYSGRYSATQSVFSFSVLAMMTTLSLASPPKVGMFCTGPCSNVFFHECAM